MKRFSLLVPAIVFFIVLQPCTASTSTRRQKDEAERKRSENLERKFKRVLDKQNAEFAVRVKGLAQWCAQKGFGAEALDLWDNAKELDPDLKGQCPAASEAIPTDDDKAAFKSKKKAVFDSQAAELFKLGSTCYKAGLIGRAYDMVWEAVICNPDHASARKLLGQAKYNGEWMDNYDVAQLKRGRVFKDEYGWVSKSDLARYEKGLMPLRGKWLPAEEVQEARSKWSSAWEFDTEHYHIQSNVSLADAVAFGKICEDNYKLFFRMFIGYFSSRNQGQMLFGGKQEKRLMKVNYFATKEQFKSTLGSIVPDMAAGIYISGRPQGSANFFKIDWATNTKILKHEATHQLFAESRRLAGGSRCGAWVVEAVATYMETCSRVDGRIVTKGRKAPWVQAFKQVLQKGMSKPLRDFDQVSYQGFMAVGPGIAYPQAASLACFLMEADDGNYRERFVDYVEAYYMGKLHAGGKLEEYTGTSYTELEDQFRTFILEDDTAAEGKPEAEEETKTEEKQKTEEKPKGEDKPKAENKTKSN